MRASGISWSTAQALAAGKSLNLESETIAKLCDALEVTPGQLLIYEPEEGSG
jgi:DNA-binding Xre family transcriptional regulator